ncbi:dTDP-N-acetylfucosamine:lipid II N-acetylfucosaminyltransferase [Marinobacterium sp. MBR-111]|uniref:TDP-N-acetylfucosamine:lipid II N-acetylfucosaminyltransferase n=1 Tax=Marinobacterium sp. MBR-111 TaxID=3156463 RepID=UPI00339A9990
MSKKILHVCNADNFIPPFIDFVEEHFGLDDHFFWLNGDFDRYSVKQEKSNYKVKRTKAGQVRGLLKLVQLMQSSEKVILHGLFNPRIVLILFLMPWLLKKCYWAIWGGDLYIYKLGERNLKWKVKEFFRRSVIKKIGHLVTYIEGDVELARKWYGARGEYHECLGYLSNLYSPHNVCVEKNSHINILIGNSADPNNNHIEAFEMLLPFKEEGVKIYLPLSYGDKKYAQKVIKMGYDWFGDKFKPLTEFMPFDEYLSLLCSIDIAIFNHRRQQAMGNTITLLGLGKTVYIRPEVSQWKFFMDKEIIVGDITKLSDLKLLDVENTVGNVREYFSKAKLIQQWSLLFDGK